MLVVVTQYFRYEVDLNTQRIRRLTRTTGSVPRHSRWPDEEWREYYAIEFTDTMSIRWKDGVTMVTSPIVATREYASDSV